MLVTGIYRTAAEILHERLLFGKKLSRGGLYRKDANGDSGVVFGKGVG